VVGVPDGAGDCADPRAAYPISQPALGPSPHGKHIMSKYRISKAGREFPADQLDTLRELATRGLLLADDLVSVDEGPFAPASTLPELADVLHEAGEALPELGDGDLAEVAAPDDLLAQFLDEVHTGSMPSVPGSPAPKPPPVALEPEAPRVVRAQPDSVPAARVPTAADLPEPTVLPLSGAIGEDSLPHGLADLPPDATPPPPPPAIEPAEPMTAQLHIPEPTPESDLPPSFNQWIESRGSSPDGKLLEGFGRYDDGILFQGGYRARSFNGIRVFLLFAVGCFLIFGWWIWVKTAAQTAYPKESELVGQIQGAPRGTVKPTLREVPTDGNRIDPDRQLLIDEGKLRQRIGQEVPFFGSATTLEDELFTALQNAGAQPAGVEVEAVATKGSGDNEHARPTKANVSLLLRGIRHPADTDPAVTFEALKEQLQIAWLVAGKFSERGNVDFLEVRVIVSEPTPWNDTYPGRDLRALWQGHRKSADFFLGK